MLGLPSAWQNAPMPNDRSHEVLLGLTEVHFVGGPLHRRRVLMADPEFDMPLEFSGQAIVYSRRIVERVRRDDASVQIATYAPLGTTDEEFARLLADAARPGNM